MPFIPKGLNNEAQEAKILLFNTFGVFLKTNHLFLNREQYSKQCQLIHVVGGDTNNGAKSV